MMMVAAAALLVVGCGGAGGSSGGGTVSGPPPSPTPTPTPSPSPSPAALYTKIAEAAVPTKYSAICNDPRVGLRLLGLGDGVRLLGDLVNDVQIVESPWSGRLTFGAADRTPGIDLPVREYSLPFDGTERTVLSLRPLRINQQLYDYVGRLDLYRRSTGGSDGYSYGCLYGAPTLTTDQPTSVIQITGRVTGIASVTESPTVSRGYNMSISESSIAFDPVQRQVTVSVTLKGTPTRDTNLPELSLGTFSQTIPLYEDAFYRDVPSGSTGQLQVSGTFFGPMFAETAVLFSITGQTPEKHSFSLIGQITGKR
ncbi:hypothetical protein ASG37_02395 [Sphingomonas sp. Leaf407]|uniref:hypothetical protein n=1 Tax=unclassified Sphingomonas TaxID=196159 RepID=UPI0006FC4608|nr:MULTISPECIES: hypothetical protein [unclassified Sphingomonas]KQN40654.1 hypothetical protein ASE97_02420 [Sphingomonas sp. Leaf42]KQT30010.1 hypothetical protein ASG37_02395 [Sphingomonas sp. Leaf407]